MSEKLDNTKATLLKQLKHVATLLATHDNLSEIMLNPDGSIWIEESGVMKRTSLRYSQQEALSIIKLLAGMNDIVCNDKEPTLSVQLPVLGGGRFQAIIPPISIAPSFALRVPPKKLFSLDDLLAAKTMTSSQAITLEKAVKHRKNILIVGGTSTGKTTIANALLNLIGTDRIIVIEDNAELKVDAENKLSMLTQKDFTLRDAVQVSMRLRPDRIIVGEIRDGGTALDLLKGWMTGHPGGIGTLHANNADEALERLFSLMQEVIVSPSKKLITTAIDYVVVVSRVQIEKNVSVRRIVEIKEIK